MSDIWAPLFNALTAAFMLILTSAVTIYTPRLIAAFEAHTGILLNQQAHDAVKEAAVTAAGIAQTMLTQGVLKLEHVTPDNPAVLKLAADAVARVPDSAALMKKSVPSMAQTIVGLIDPKIGPRT